VISRIIQEAYLKGNKQQLRRWRQGCRKDLMGNKLHHRKNCFLRDKLQIVTTNQTVLSGQLFDLQIFASHQHQKIAKLLQKEDKAKSAL
jgi:hypothetical protein